MGVLPGLVRGLLIALLFSASAASGDAYHDYAQALRDARGNSLLTQIILERLAQDITRDRSQGGEAWNGLRVQQSRIEKELEGSLRALVQAGARDRLTEAALLVQHLESFTGEKRGGWGGARLGTKAIADLFELQKLLPPAPESEPYGLRAQLNRNFYSIVRREIDRNRIPVERVPEFLALTRAQFPKYVPALLAQLNEHGLLPASERATGTLEFLLARASVPLKDAHAGAYAIRTHHHDILDGWRALEKIGPAQLTPAQIQTVRDLLEDPQTSVLQRIAAISAAPETVTAAAPRLNIGLLNTFSEDQLRDLAREAHLPYKPDAVLDPSVVEQVRTATRVSVASSALQRLNDRAWLAEPIIPHQSPALEETRAALAFLRSHADSVGVDEALRQFSFFANSQTPYEAWPLRGQAIDALPEMIRRFPEKRAAIEMLLANAAQEPVEWVRGRALRELTKIPRLTPEASVRLREIISTQSTPDLLIAFKSVLSPVEGQSSDEAAQNALIQLMKLANIEPSTLGGAPLGTPPTSGAPCSPRKFSVIAGGKP